MLLIDGPASSVLSLAFSPCGHYLVSGHANGAVRILNGAGDQLQIFGEEDPSARYSVVFGDAETKIHFGAASAICTWSPGEPASNSFFKEAPEVVVLSVQPVNSKILAIGLGHPNQSRAGRLMLWDILKCQVLPPTFREPDGVRGVAVHAETKTVAWITSGRLWSIWNITKPDRKQFPLKNPARAISFHPDGEILGLASNWEVLLWKSGLNKEIATLKGHKGIVSSLAFSPAGALLASGSWDGTVRVWELSTGRERSCFRWPIGRVNALCYAPDGLRLAAAGDNGQVVIWDTD
jgi:WD40 repeat protein